MFEFKEFTKDDVIAISVSGKIEKQDYEKLTPVIEKTERDNEKIRLYVEIGELDGITWGALMKDITTYFKHARNFKKVAVVGEGNYSEETWAKISNPFIKAEVKHFPKEEQVLAEEWIKS